MIAKNLATVEQTIRDLLAIAKFNGMWSQTTCFTATPAGCAASRMTAATPLASELNNSMLQSHGRGEAWLDEGHGACYFRERRWVDDLR